VFIYIICSYVRVLRVGRLLNVSSLVCRFKKAIMQMEDQKKEFGCRKERSKTCKRGEQEEDDRKL